MTQRSFDADTFDNLPSIDRENPSKEQEVTNASLKNYQLALKVRFEDDIDIIEDKVKVQMERYSVYKSRRIADHALRQLDRDLDQFICREFHLDDMSLSDQENEDNLSDFSVESVEMNEMDDFLRHPEKELFTLKEFVKKHKVIMENLAQELKLKFMKPKPKLSEQLGLKGKNAKDFNLFQSK